MKDFYVQTPNVSSVETGDYRNIYGLEAGLFAERNGLGLEIGARHLFSHEIPHYIVNYNGDIGRNIYYLQNQINLLYIGTYFKIPYLSNTSIFGRLGYSFSSGNFTGRWEDTGHHYRESKYSFSSSDVFYEFGVKQMFKVNKNMNAGIELGYTVLPIKSLVFVNTKTETNIPTSGTFGPQNKSKSTLNSPSLDASHYFLKLRVEYGWHWLTRPVVSPSLGDI